MVNALARPDVGTARSAPTRVEVVMLGVAIVLTGFDLRTVVTSLSSVLGEVRADLGVSGSVAGVVAALPVLCFAVLGGFAARTVRRQASTTVLAVASAAMAAGLAIRALAPGAGLLVAGTVLALAGIALANVLIPPLVRTRFPGRVATMTGLFTVSVTLGVAVPAAVTPPLGDALGGGWRTGLAVWAIVPAVAVAAWLMARRGDAPTATPEPTAQAPAERPWRSPTAWALLVFFGLQSLIAFTSLGWLPSVLTDAGVPTATAGVLLSVTAFGGVPFALVISPWAARTRRPWIAVVLIGGAVGGGWLGLLVAPASAPWLWAVLLIGTSCTYPLAIALINRVGGSERAVLRMSGFVQTGGYVLAAVGPFAAGALRQATGGWGLPVLMVLTAVVVQTVAGTLACRTRAPWPGAC